MSSLWRPLEAGIYKTFTWSGQLNGTEKFQEMPSASQGSEVNEASQECRAEQASQVKEGEIILPVSQNTEKLFSYFIFLQTV